MATAAKRELLEETGFTAVGPFTPLVPVRQSAKLVYAWAAEGDGDVSTIVSNAFQIEYPARSGRIRTFSEVDRAEWFEKMDKPSYCLWWIPAGLRPTVDEGRERLEHYQRYGATPYSFWFSQHFPQPAAENVGV